MTRWLWLSILILALWFGPGNAQEDDEYQTPQELADENGAFVTVSDVSLYYVSEGNPEDDAVIFIHGFGGSTFSWRDTLAPVAEAGYYAIALDLPPFGLSDKSADIGYAHQDFAGYVAGLLDALEIEQATIIGHSMGGSVTAYFAREYTERVEKLVFVAGGVFEAIDLAEGGGGAFDFLSIINPEAPAAVGLLRSLLTPERFSSTLTSAYADDNEVTDEIAAGYQRPLLIEDWPVGFLAFLQASEENPITLDQLADVATMPTLILWGEEDTWVPLELGEVMDDALPNATLITYPSIGHLPMEEAPTQFNKDLIAFLDE